jgi:hypothetical protein
MSGAALESGGHVPHAAGSWLVGIMPRLGLAASGHSPVQDIAACPDSPRGLSGSRRGVSQSAMAEHTGRFTLLMERLILDVLTECATGSIGIIPAVFTKPLDTRVRLPIELKNHKMWLYFGGALHIGSAPMRKAERLSRGIWKTS